MLYSPGCVLLPVFLHHGHRGATKMDALFSVLQYQTNTVKDEISMVWIGFGETNAPMIYNA